MLYPQLYDTSLLLSLQSYYILSWHCRHVENSMIYVTGQCSLTVKYSSAFLYKLFLLCTIVNLTVLQMIYVTGQCSLYDTMHGFHFNRGGMTGSRAQFNYILKVLSSQTYTDRNRFDIVLKMDFSACFVNLQQYSKTAQFSDIVYRHFSD